ncbi:hypothetical protein GCM10008107_20830 [Psychrosphaera saromensis]|uniref:Uncharacterized protein n=1 Tax=Psychrosphaera saromensis TaxID=716813 RepID=A0A2S7US51_9GAMM|nr:hypothetical protein [Psychrosphaera saromensis]PQJ52773.1 hypothetical protein BTO11_03290 [Psychrosphaera saromensis]GHB71152.1 hypothetical protein GCM10008107_20830 [Psychrosphaera saromensis]GLQ13269.1 hypothetical protein GCM10007917_07240 [Psychrosphaera saromensis]
MRSTFRKIFSPILNFFESGEGEFNHEKSHRKITIVVGILFFVLSGVSAMSAITSEQLAGFIPFIVFFLLGFVCEIVGLLGNDRAVSKIWGNK